MDSAILIQARLSSQRLPGKVLFKLGNTNFNSISLMGKRLEILKDKMTIAVITSLEKCDDSLYFFSKANNLECLRGSQNDVLERYYNSAKLLNCKNIIRLTSDCPLIDPKEIMRVFEIHKKNKNDYTTNTFNGSTLVDGFDVEVFTFEALKRAYIETNLPSHREHVTFYFTKENNFRVEYCDPDLNFPYTRLTLDTPEDYEAISRLVEKINNLETISMKEIINIFYANQFNDINSSVTKNHGWIKSLNEDEILKKKSS